MKTDIDRLMQEKQIDALLICGPAVHNPAMVYLTGGGHITNADLIKPRGKPGVLFHGPMERDEAARTGLETRSYSDYPWTDFLKQAGGDSQKASASRYRKMFADLGITAGRVALYGKVELGGMWSALSGLKALEPDLELVGETQDQVLPDAMATKDAVEIERIRRMGAITVAVVGKAADFLSSRRAKGDVVVHRGGSPVTVGEVKSKIDLWLAEAGAENPESTIFAIGRDAGVPHSAGQPGDVLRLGQTIVFDIYPCEKGGGYFYDFTRTWCLGYAPDDVMQLYEQVLGVYRQMFTEVRGNAYYPDFQRRTCELFEAQGHPTILSDPKTEEGYVHSLGHGLGLHIHERPWSGSTATPKDVLAPGSVFTIEPGLYYPSRGMGVRLEDSAWVRPDGQVEKLADYPLDLVLPVNGK